MTDEVTPAQKIDMAWRTDVMSLCAPIWWEQGRRIIVNSGSMCVVQTPEALFGITNHHVLKIYERHRAEKDDIFCQLGSAPFDPTDNLISASKYWDLATFTIPFLTLQRFAKKVFLAREWPPRAINKDDWVYVGGYPEHRRKVPAGPNPPSMTADFVSFLRQPHTCTPEYISFHIDTAKVTWLPSVHKPLESGVSLSGMSGGPCFRLVVAEDRLELAGFIHEGRCWDDGIILCRQASLISATGQIAPVPLGVRQRNDDADDEAEREDCK